MSADHRLAKLEDAARAQRWQHEDDERQLIAASKAQQRVVLQRDLAAWSSRPSQPDADHEQPDVAIVAPSAAAADASPRAAVSQRSSTPLRPTTRVFTEFTAPLSASNPSLPARNGAQETPALQRAQDSMALHRLLPLKEKADALFRATDLLSAANVYKHLLESTASCEAVAAHSQLLAFRCRVASNVATCYAVLSRKSNTYLLASQQLTHAQLAIDAAHTALNDVQWLSEGDQEAMMDKLHRRIASQQERLGRWEVALQHWRALKTAQPQTFEARLLQFAQQKKQNHAAVCMQRIHALCNGGQDQRMPSSLQEQLMSLAQEALSIEPCSWQALASRGKTSIRMRSWTSAVYDFIFALACESHATDWSVQSKASLLAYKAFAHQRNGELSLAKADLSQAIDCTPSDSLQKLWHEQLSILMLESKRKTNLKMARVKMKQSCWQEARQLLDELLADHVRNTSTDVFCVVEDHAECDCHLLASWKQTRIVLHCRLLSDACLCAMQMQDFVRARTLAEAAIQLSEQISLNPIDVHNHSNELAVLRAQLEARCATCQAALGALQLAHDGFLRSLIFLPSSDHAEALLLQKDASTCLREHARLVATM